MMRVQESADAMWTPEDEYGEVVVREEHPRRQIVERAIQDFASELKRIAGEKVPAHTERSRLSSRAEG